MMKEQKKEAKYAGIKNGEEFSGKTFGAQKPQRFEDFVTCKCNQHN